MEKFVFTMDELEELNDLISDCSRYEGTYDTPPAYDQFLENIFGDDWSELMGEWDDLYELEGDMDFYLQVVKGIDTERLKEWMEQGQEILERIENN